MNMDTCIFGNWQPIVPIKLSQNQGALPTDLPFILAKISFNTCIAGTTFGYDDKKALQGETTLTTHYLILSM